jgi:predicted metal-dependent peptidase
MALTPEQVISAATIAAVRRMPYLGAMIFGLERYVSDKVVDHGGHPTFGITANGVLMIHPAAAMEWFNEPTQHGMGGTQAAVEGVGRVATVLLHEAMHHALRHPARMRRMDPWQENGEDANCAADLTINHLLSQAGCHFPGNPVMPQQYGLTGDESMEEAFAHILKNKPPRPPNQGQGPCSGQCGSGAGNPLPNEPKPKGQNPEGDGNGEDDQQPQDPNQPPPPKGKSEADLDRMARQFAKEVQEASARDPGSVPAGLKRWADEMLKPATISWQEYLANVVSHAIEYRPGAQDFVYGRMSRRQAGVGFGPGKPILPAMIEPTPRVGVVLDTSGSMSKAQLTEALCEIQGVLETAGSEISFVACDAQATEPQLVDTIEQVAELMQGGGGTDMKIGINAVLDQAEPPEVVIVLSDLCVPDPGEAPDNCTVIWCGVGSDPNWKAPWGELVRVGATYPA